MFKELFEAKVTIKDTKDSFTFEKKGDRIKIQMVKCVECPEFTIPVDEFSKCIGLKSGQKVHFTGEDNKIKYKISSYVRGAVMVSFTWKAKTAGDIEEMVSLSKGNANKVIS